MLLKEIKDWFKEIWILKNDFEQISINKIDNNLEKALCFYNSKRNIELINKLDLSTYSMKPLTILLRYGKNQDIAEQKINKLYQFFYKRIDVIGNKKVVFEHCYENPINLGTDDKGVQEYSLEINIYYEKEEE